jgi:hypothetical protein
MKRAVLGILAVSILAANVAFAHGDAEHVRGIVTNITDTAITVDVSGKKPRTVTVDAKTMVMRGKSHLALKDVRVGDRVVLDVDKKTSVASEITLAAGAPATTTTTTTAGKRKG